LSLSYFDRASSDGFLQPFGLRKIDVCETFLFVDFNFGDGAKGSESGFEEGFGDALGRVGVFEEGLYGGG